MDNGTYRSICTLCHSGCGIKVSLKNNRMTNIKPDTDHPANRNFLCPKAAAIEELSLSEDRLKTPLKRVNDSFVPISWEEAYSIAASKLLEVLNKYGPDGIMRCSGAPVSYGARDGFNSLMKAMGSANATGSSTYCMVPRVTAFMSAIGGKPEPDFDNSDYIIMWGSNPKATNRMGGYCAFDGVQDVLKRARKRGVPIVFIDPVECESIEKEDIWIKIKPGTDAVLGLGMLRQIINRGLYNRSFVEDWTVGFDELRQHVQKYTPEYTEAVTGVPAELMVRTAEDFAGARTALICEGNGLDMYCNTVYTVQTIAALCGITGRIDAKGGLVFLPFIPQSPMNNLSPALMKQKYKYPLFRDVPFPAVKESLLAGDQDRPRAMIVHHANPVLINSNSKRTFEAMRKLDFLMVCDIFMTATARAADLVIPDRTAFEYWGYKAYTSFSKPFAALQRPLFSPPSAECGGKKEPVRSVFESEYQIARLMGLGENFPFTDDISWIKYGLAPSGITFEDLLEKQIIYLDKPIVYQKYLTNGFNTPSKKMELFSQRYKDLGYSPLPLEIPANPELETMETRPDGSDGPQAFPLTVINYRPGNFVHTKLHNIPAAVRLHPFSNVWMNKTNIDKYGLKTGDPVTVQTPYGEQTFITELKDSLDNDQIMLEFGWGNPTDCGADINSLTSDRFFDPISGTTPNRLYRARLVKQPSGSI